MASVEMPLRVHCWQCKARRSKGMLSACPKHSQWVDEEDIDFMLAQKVSENLSINDEVIESKHDELFAETETNSIAGKCQKCWRPIVPTTQLCQFHFEHSFEQRLGNIEDDLINQVLTISKQEPSLPKQSLEQFRLEFQKETRLKYLFTQIDRAIQLIHAEKSLYESFLVQLDAHLWARDNTKDLPQDVTHEFDKHIKLLHEQLSKHGSGHTDIGNWQSWENCLHHISKSDLILTREMFVAKQERVLCETETEAKKKLKLEKNTHTQIKNKNSSQNKSSCS